MIRSMILATRCESPGVKGRKSTRVKSGSMITARAANVNGSRTSDHTPTAIGSLKLVTMFCARRISANDSRKANVDSAP